VNSANDFAFIETFADQSADFSKVERLESGSETSLFKTITKGTIRWEGHISGVCQDRCRFSCIN